MTPDNRADGALAEAWCQPMGCGKHTPRVFLIRFEDTEVGDLTFTDEGEARDMFVKLNQNWNCYLMASLPLVPRPADGALDDAIPEPCGGCGEPDPGRRCIGCMHDFFPDRASAEASLAEGEPLPGAPGGDALAEAFAQLHTISGTDNLWAEKDFNTLPGQDRMTATVLNAVLSGQLIPLEACNARVAAVVEAALAQAGLAIANLEIGYHDGVSGDWHPYPGPTILSAGCAAIRAITPADAQAALDAMISRAREVKPLAWLSGWFCDQEAFYADTAVGNWAVVQYSSRNGRWAYDDPSGETSDEDWESASLAQAAVHLEHTARIHAALRANAMDASEGER